jgi:beta-lactamase class A
MRISKYLILSGLSLLVLAGGLSLFRNHASADSEAAPVEHKLPKGTNTTPQFNTNNLTNELDDITSHYTGLDIGVAVTSLDSGQHYTYGDTAPYIGASTTKVLTGVFFLHQLEAGKYTLRQTIGTRNAAAALNAMLVQSDNEAWTAFLAKLGRSNLQTYAQSIGMTSYNAKDNKISITDMALLLQKLHDGELLNQTNTNLLLSHMQKSIRSYIGPGVGTGYTVYHKAGWLDDRLMDAAIVTSNSHKFVLVIYSKAYTGNYDFGAGSILFKNIAASVTRTLSEV